MHAVCVRVCVCEHVRAAGGGVSRLHTGRSGEEERLEMQP